VLTVSCIGCQKSMTGREFHGHGPARCADNARWDRIFSRHADPDYYSRTPERSFRRSSLVAEGSIIAGRISRAALREVCV
jgi:hypothetical protein